MFQVFEVAVRYQMYHALGLIAVAWAASQWNSQLIAASGWLFAAGIVIFSGSLYILSLTRCPLARCNNTNRRSRLYHRLGGVSSGLQSETKKVPSLH